MNTHLHQRLDTLIAEYAEPDGNPVNALSTASVDLARRFIDLLGDSPAPDVTLGPSGHVSFHWRGPDGSFTVQFFGDGAFMYFDLMAGRHVLGKVLFSEVEVSRMLKYVADCTRRLADSSPAWWFEPRFYQLAAQWKEETKVLSTMREIAAHPAYQEIIGMGEAVVPLILADLASGSDHWFWALKQITGEDPVRLEDRGNIEAMRAAWLNWGQQHFSQGVAK